MRVKTIQIVWHESKPIYTLDFHSSGILVTGGGDNDIKLWEVKADSALNPTVTHIGHLVGHNRDVNVLRFSPSGQLLASAGVGGEMYLWKPTAEVQKVFGSEDSNAGWKRAAVLRGHADDVQDLSWASDSSALMSGSIENICHVWDVEAGSSKGRFQDHRHYVQGVAWDPVSEFLVSQSADRTCRVYAPKAPVLGKKKAKRPAASAAVNAVLDMQCLHVLSKRAMPVSGEGMPASEQIQQESKPQRFHLFQDEQLNSFFRRLAWSPDGSCLVVPCGQYQQTADSPTLHTAYVYARGHWAQPMLRLPAMNKAVVIIRFCPQLFSLREAAQPVDQQAAEKPEAAFRLPYRMVFAIATLDSVIIFDTQKPTPLAVLGALHFEVITDLAWSSDGSFLAISSYDGYCSIASFDKGELGEALPEADLPVHLKARIVNPGQAKSGPHSVKRPSLTPGCSSMPPPSVQTVKQRKQEEDCSPMQPLPMRQMQPAANAVSKQLSAKRIAPIPIAPGEDRSGSSGTLKKIRKIAPESV